VPETPGIWPRNLVALNVSAMRVVDPAVCRHPACDNDAQVLDDLARA
jgi:hypothetical protein